jgi:hypothetical protein
MGQGAEHVRVDQQRTGAANELAQLRTSDAYGPLLAAFSDAEERGLDIEATLPRLASEVSFRGVVDIAAVLHERLDRWINAAGRPRHELIDPIAGLVPRMRSVADPDVGRALDDRARAIEDRARTLG